jgi:predicted Na+-dependent transporter
MISFLESLLCSLQKVVMLPVNLLLYASSSYSSAVVKSLDWDALFMSIFVVIGGISSGLFCSAYFKDSPAQSHQIHKHANRFGNVAGICLISFSILVSSSDHKAALWDQGWQFFVGLAIPALIGITVATALATGLSLEKPERVAVAVESSYQVRPETWLIHSSERFFSFRTQVANSR